MAAERIAVVRVWQSVVALPRSLTLTQGASVEERCQRRPLAWSLSPMSRHFAMCESLQSGPE